MIEIDHHSIMMDDLIRRVRQGERTERRRLLLTALERVRPHVEPHEDTSLETLRRSLPAIRDRCVGAGLRATTVATYLSRIRSSLEQEEGPSPPAGAWSVLGRGPVAGPNPSPMAGPNPSPMAGPNPSPMAGPNPSPMAGPNPSPFDAAGRQTSWERELEVAFEHVATWPKLRRYLLPILIKLEKEGDVGPERLEP